MRGRKPNVNRWEDHYTRRAKKEQFPARSVFKLKEIQHKFHLIKAGQRVLDLGCAPGSWLLYAAGLVGPEGRVIGVDLKPVTVRLPSNVRVLEADLLAPEGTLTETLAAAFDVLLSDMAPATTGRKEVDAVRSMDLCRAALDLSRNVLRPGAAMVCKIFQGSDFKELTASVGKAFAAHKLFKPQSSRKASKEIYIIATGKR